jgi:tetratricopeptide (TPR) repeat protein
MKQDRYQQAIALLKELPANNPTVQWNLGYAYSQAGEQDKATEYIRKILEFQANTRLAMIAEARLGELERKEKRLAVTRRGFTIALLGLGGVLVIGLIVMITRGFQLRMARAEHMKPADILALNIQVGLAIVSGLFGLLSVFLTSIVK